jgi:hypothetical protein
MRVDDNSPADRVDGSRPTQDEAIAGQKDRVLRENEIGLERPGRRARHDTQARGSLARALMQTHRPPALERRGRRRKQLDQHTGATRRQEGLG